MKLHTLGTLQLTTVQLFQEADVFQMNASWSNGRILFIYQLLSLEYEVTVQSGNDTTTDAELVVFEDFADYTAYISGYEYI